MTETQNENREKMKQIYNELEKIRDTLGNFRELEPVKKVLEIIDFVEAFEKYYNSLAIVYSLKYSRDFEFEYHCGKIENAKLTILGPCGERIEYELKDNKYIDVFELRNRVFNEVLLNPSLWGCLARHLNEAITGIVTNIYNDIHKLENKLNELRASK